MIKLVSNTGLFIFITSISTTPSFSNDISDLLWKSRVLIVSTRNNETSIVDITNEFKRKYFCQLKERKVRIITFIDDANPKYSPPSFVLGKNGIWLIGYDGKVKSYSRDKSILSKIFVLIDKMPIREAELARQPSNCPE